jgi:hypothetical protein
MPSNHRLSWGLSDHPRTGIIVTCEASRSAVADRSGEREAVSRGTGNLFSDLGFPDAAERQAKLRLAITQPKVSALRHYKLTGISVERLMNLLTAVDQDVEIVIRRKPRSRRVARVRVVAA